MDPALLVPWILPGEEGTFSDEHVEPAGLHVWVHLFHGVKLWFVEAKLPLVNPLVEPHKVADIRLVSQSPWPTIAAALPANSPAVPRQEPVPLADCEWTAFLQSAGDTVVMPPDWRHLVLNVTHTFAVATNFRWPLR